MSNGEKFDWTQFKESPAQEPSGFDWSQFKESESFRGAGATGSWEKEGFWGGVVGEVKDIAKGLYGMVARPEEVVEGVYRAFSEPLEEGTPYNPLTKGVGRLVIDPLVEKVKQIHRQAKFGDPGGAAGRVSAQAALFAIPWMRRPIGKGIEKLTSPIGSRLKAPMSKAMQQPIGIDKTSPIETIPRIEVVKAAREHGINPTAAEATGIRKLEQVQQFGERAFIGAGKLEKIGVQNQTKLLAWSDDLIRKVNPSQAAPELELISATDIRGTLLLKFPSKPKVGRSPTIANIEEMFRDYNPVVTESKGGITTQLKTFRVTFYDPITAKLNYKTSAKALQEVLGGEQLYYEGLRGARTARHGPEPVASAAESGAAMKKSAQQSMETTRANTAKAFSELESQVGPARVDVSPIRKTFQAKWDELKRTLAMEPEILAKPAEGILEKGARIGIPKEPPLTIGGQSIQASKLSPRVRKELGIPETVDDISFTEAHRLRSDFWDIGYKGGEFIPKRAQGLARQLGHEIEVAMEKSARRLGPRQHKVWRDADAQWKAEKLVYDSPKSPVNAILKQPDATEVMGKLSKRAPLGGSVEVIQIIRGAGISLNPLKSQVLQRIREAEFRIKGNKVGGYSHAYLNELFTAKEVAELRRMAAVNRMITLEGGGLIGTLAPLIQLGGLMAGQVSPLIGHTVAAKLASSRRLSRYLTRGTVPAGQSKSLVPKKGR